MNRKILITSGPAEGLMFELPANAVCVVGRSSKSDICIRDDVRMSGTHFQFDCGPDVILVTDLKSTNGTFVNERRLQKWILRKGDEIRAGRTVFAFEQDASETRKLPSAPKAETKSKKGTESISGVDSKPGAKKKLRPIERVGKKPPQPASKSKNTNPVAESNKLVKPTEPMKSEKSVESERVRPSLADPPVKKLPGLSRTSPVIEEPKPPTDPQTDESVRKRREIYERRRTAREAAENGGKVASDESSKRKNAPDNKDGPEKNAERDASRAKQLADESLKRRRESVSGLSSASPKSHLPINSSRDAETKSQKLSKRGSSRERRGVPRNRIGFDCPFPSGLIDEDPDVRFAAEQAAAWRDPNALLEHCRAIANDSTSEHIELLTLYAALADDSDLDRFAAILTNEELGPERFAVIVAYGNPGLVSLLVEQLENPESCQDAADAFYSITGHELPQNFEGVFDRESAGNLWERTRNDFQISTRWHKGIDLNDPSIGDRLGEFSMLARTHICLRANAFGEPLRSPIELSCHPQLS